MTLLIPAIHCVCTTVAIRHDLLSGVDVGISISDVHIEVEIWKYVVGIRRRLGFPCSTIQLPPVAQQTQVKWRTEVK